MSEKIEGGRGPLLGADVSLTKPIESRARTRDGTMIVHTTSGIPGGPRIVLHLRIFKGNSPYLLVADQPTIADRASTRSGG